MVNKIIESIAYKLSTIYPDKNVYDEYVAQNFKKGGFFIDIIEQDYTKLLNNVNESSVEIDLSYIPKAGKEKARSEMREIKQTLFRELGDIGEFRVSSKSANIVDDVLHIVMTINYREVRVIAQEVMKTITQNTNLKEE